MVPDSITPDQARRFARHIVDYLNQRLPGTDDVELTDVSCVQLEAGRASMYVLGQAGHDPDTHHWGTHRQPETHMYATTNDRTSETLPWVEDLGLDPQEIMSLTLHGAYLQVVGFTRHDGVRRLRHGVEDGFQKYQIDIPIIENGDLK